MTNIYTFWAPVKAMVELVWSPYLSMFDHMTKAAVEHRYKR